MTPTLVQQRCFNHGFREAVARCPECGRFFCRECITEHEDRMVCTVCLGRLGNRPLRRHGFFTRSLTMIQLMAGLAMLWLIFYLLGSVMLSLPDSFHDGSIWQGNWFDKP